MNANTVYVLLDPGADAKAFGILDELYENGIWAIVTVDLDGTYNLDRLTTIVPAYKDHPAVLMWANGYEWTINWFHGAFQSLDAAAAAAQVAALKVKALDANHPVASIIGEIKIANVQPIDKTADIVTSICTAFEWNDEWWKVREEDGGDDNTHDPGGFASYWNPYAHPDGFANEEYFGIVGIGREKKAAYYTLAKKFGYHSRLERNRPVLLYLQRILGTLQ